MSVDKEELPETKPRWRIPNHWEWVSLAEVGDIITGNTPLTKEADNYGAHIPFVKPPELTDRGVRSAANSLSEKGIKSARLLAKGAVLVSCIIGLGKTGLAKVSVAFNQQINAVVFDDRVVPEFGFYYAQTLKPWLYEVSSATTLPIVNKGKFQRAPFPLAPIAEQHRIVAEIEKQFSRLDEAVANIKRVKANLKRYKAAVLKAAVEGQLTEEWRKQHPDIEPASKLLERILIERRAKWKGRGRYEEPSAPETTDLASLPKGWKWATVEQLSMLVQYGSSAKTREETIGVPVLRMGNIEDARLRFDSLKYLPKNHDEFPGLFLQEGDILFNRTNSAELVGKTAVYKGKPDPCSFASYLIRVRLVQGCAPDFLAYFINSVFGRAWIGQVVTQQVGQANVNGTKLQALAVPLPPLDEQGLIVAEVERRLSVIDKLEAAVQANLARAERLRQSILGQAFSGKLLFNGAHG